MAGMVSKAVLRIAPHDRAQMQHPQIAAVEPRLPQGVQKPKGACLMRPLLLWLIGIPLPIIILLWLAGAFH
jgi:hypothetical protein